jgi:hypothetical protein
MPTHFLGQTRRDWWFVKPELPGLCDALPSDGGEETSAVVEERCVVGVPTIHGSDLIS